MFFVIAEREKLGYSGTPGHEESVVDAFYANYTKVLQAHNDSHHSEFAKGRGELRELFYAVADQFKALLKQRNYITHARVDAYVEYVISSMAVDGYPFESFAADLSVGDIAAYLRLTFVLRLGREAGAALPEPDWDELPAKITKQLRSIEKSSLPFKPRVLHYFLAEFAGAYPDALEPSKYRGL